MRIVPFWCNGGAALRSGRLTNRGFTMLELTVTLAVMGLMLAVAVPSLRSFLASQAVDAHANELASALRFARSEALKRGYEVTVCAGASGTCSGSNDWDAGFVVFVDNNAGVSNGAFDPGERALRVKDGAMGVGLITSTARSVTIARTGILFAVNGSAAATTSIAIQPVGGSADSRTVCLNKQGRITILRGGSAVCN